MHLAYILLAHTAPRQLCRLVDRLDGDHALFLIHIDRRAPEGIFAGVERGLGSNPRVTFIPRRPSRRTTFGLVEAPLDALKTLIRRHDSFDYVILLTGQDYPIKPQGALLRHLDDNPDLCFLHSFPIEDPILSEWPAEATFRYKNWHLGFGNPRWSIPLNRRLPGDRVPFGGSMYWALSRSAVTYVIDVIEREPQLVKFFKHTFVPDEMFFQTILMNSPLRDRVTSLKAPDCYGLHYIDWHLNQEHPRTLGITDLPKLHATPAFFARKFDSSADELVLERIDLDLLGHR
jgi:hypothetical protein